MNIQLIRKIIKLHETKVPELSYENPFLDKNVARAFSRSFIKVLNSENSNVNNKLRDLMIENLRKLCRREPEGHAKISENVLDIVLKSYEKLYNGKCLNEDISNRDLEAFLIRTLSCLNLNSTYCLIDCDIVQALYNMGVFCNERFLKDIVIHLNENDIKAYKFLTNIWCTLELSDPYLINDLSIKLKQVIERELLDVSLEALKSEHQNLTNILLSNNFFMRLVKRSSISPNCFQTCCFILSSLFIRSNFDICLKCITQIFLSNVKITTMPAENFFVLYPKHLQSLVLMLFTDFDLLSCKHYHNFFKSVFDSLNKLPHRELIMVLSHNENWLDLYTKEVLEDQTSRKFSVRSQ